MSQTNINIVEEYIEYILNQRQVERIFEFCSKDCILHTTPYVGLGVNFDDTSGDRLILTQVAPNGPADGHLHPGDELIRVKNGDRNWETFEELRKGLWSRGLVDTEICLTLRRHGNITTIPLRLGTVNDFNLKVTEFYRMAIPYLQQYWPDLKMDVKDIFGAGNKVACYAVNHGINTEYNRSAVWGEMDIFKLKDGRITDIWAVENTFEEFEQLGYQITEPAREFA
jgi:hypothetical protein